MDFIANHIGDIICLAYYPILFLSWKRIEEAGLEAFNQILVEMATINA